MPDFNLRSDAVNVEQIMEQIRARIREKRGVDYTEAQIHELASVKLDKFLDPRGLRSDLLEQFRRTQPPYAPPELPNYTFEADTLFTSTRGSLRWIRKLLAPILKLFFNPNPLIQALNIQARLNASVAQREATRDAARHAFDQLHYEVMHNLVIETTRLGIEVKNLKMRLESLSSRLEFNERRARALESVVSYKPAAEERPPRRDEGRRDEPRREEGRRSERRREEVRLDDTRPQESRRAEPPARQLPPAPPLPSDADATVQVPALTVSAGEQVQPPAAGPEGPGQKSRRRRRRRGRRGTGSAVAIMGGEQPTADASTDVVQEGDEDEASDATEAPETHVDNLAAPSPARVAEAPSTPGDGIPPTGPEPVTTAPSAIPEP